MCEQENGGNKPLLGRFVTKLPGMNENRGVQRSVGEGRAD